MSRTTIIFHRSLPTIGGHKVCLTALVRFLIHIHIHIRIEAILITIWNGQNIVVKTNASEMKRPTAHFAKMNSSTVKNAIHKHIVFFPLSNFVRAVDCGSLFVRLRIQFAVVVYNNNKCVQDEKIYDGIFVVVFGRFVVAVTVGHRFYGWW